MEKRSRLWIIIGLLIAGYASADTGWSPAYIGSAAFGDYENYVYDETGDFGEHPSVRMADEKVDIYLHYCGAAVNAEFLFVNEGPATTVDMFYPLTWGWKSNTSYDFELYEVGEYGSLERVDCDIYKNDNGSDYGTIARWQMPFGQNEELRIICRYIAGYGWTTEEVNWPRWQLKNVEGHYEEYSSNDDLIGLLPYSARYILTTGCAWKGPIGHGLIAFHTTEEVVWEDLINYRGKLHLNDGWSATGPRDELLTALGRNDDISVQTTADAIVFEFEDIDSGNESFDALSELLERGIPISIDQYPDKPYGLKSSASSTLPSSQDYAFNPDYMGYDQTSGFHAWCEGVSGEGIGEWIKTEACPGEYPVKPLRLKGVHLYGGFHSNSENPGAELFYKNGAPSAVTVDLLRDGEIVYADNFDLTTISADREDSFGIGSVYLGLDGLIECDAIKVTIDKVRPGSQWDDTCISGIIPVFADGRVRHFASSSLIESRRNICGYHPIKIDDGKLDTCWAEGVAGDGVGEWVELDWEETREISEVSISAGYAGDEGLFAENGRPKTLKMELFSASGKLLDSKELDLEDTQNPQEFSVGNGGVNGVKRVRFTIIGVYPGNKYDDTCIAEIDVR